MTKKINLTAVILTKNNQEEIKNCLDKLSFCDEIVVVDDYSSDKTVEIAENLGAKVFQRKLDNDFSAQRNFGLEKASGRWVLFIDSDERVEEELAKEIAKFTNNFLNDFSGYSLIRKDYFLGKSLKSTEAGRKKILRLAQKEAGKWERFVHEEWKIKGKVGLLKNPLLHYPHKNLDDFISQINFYSTLHAQANLKEGKRSNLFKIIFWPKAKFIENWIIKGGYKDGMYGFVISLIMSFHSFLAWSKLWLWQKSQK